MKVLTGLIGLVIFAISLPSASQTTEDVARVAFFDDVVKPSEGDYVCTSPIPLTLKASFVRSVELGNLKFANGKFVLANQNVAVTPIVNQLISQARTYCMTQNSMVDQQNAAQSANDAALKAKYDKYVADQKAAADAAAAAARTGSNKPGSGGASSNLQASTAFLKEGQAIRKEYKAEEAALAASQAKKNGTSSDGAPAATTAAPAAAAAGTAAAGTAPAAGAAVATTGGASGKVPAPEPRTFGDLTVDTANKTVKIPMGDKMELTELKYDPKSGNFVTADGSQSIPPSALANTPNCDAACTTAVNQAAGNPQTAGAVGDMKAAATGMDATSKSATALTTKAAQTFGTSMNTAGTTLFSTSCTPMGKAILAATDTYVAQITSCGERQGSADTFCSTIRSPKAMAVQRLMTVGSALLSRSSSASEGCSTAQKFATLAQYGMTAANLACTGLKIACDVSCASAKANLDTVATVLNMQQTACSNLLREELAAAVKANTACEGCMTAEVLEVKREIAISVKAFGSMTATVSKEKPLPTAPAAKIVQCEKYEMDILDMGLQILGTMDAAKQAKACRKALGDGGGGGGGTNTNPISMDEFCKVPGQAANPPCLCRTSPTATGCPGALTTTTTTTTASNAANGGGTRTTGTGGSSAMATPGGLTGMQTGSKSSSLSKEAKAALGITDDAGLTAAEAEAAAAAAAGGVGNGDTSGGGMSGGGGSNALAKSPTDIAKKTDANKKGGVGSGFDDFSLGGLSSYKFGPDGKATINGKKYTEDEIKKMVERKIASEEFHIQVTTASGKSNWDKVRVRYDENRSSLYP